MSRTVVTEKSSCLKWQARRRSREPSPDLDATPEPTFLRSAQHSTAQHSTSQHSEASHICRRSPLPLAASPAHFREFPRQRKARPQLVAKHLDAGQKERLAPHLSQAGDLQNGGHGAPPHTDPRPGSTQGRVRERHLTSSKVCGRQPLNSGWLVGWLVFIRLDPGHGISVFLPPLRAMKGKRGGVIRYVGEPAFGPTHQRHYLPPPRPR